MIIEDLFHDPSRRSYANMPSMDPLTDEDALQEAVLMDVRFNVLESIIGLLFDLRTSLELHPTNTGVLIARGVYRVEWDETEPVQERMNFPVGSVPDNREGRFGLRLGSLTRYAELYVQASAAEFYAGDVPTLGDTLPDFGEDTEDAIREGLADWNSTFIPEFATFLDPPSVSEGDPSLA